MTDRRSLPVPTRSVPRLTGVLLLLAGLALGASVVAAVPAFVETVGFALVGAAVCAFADLALSGRRLGGVALALIVLGIAERLAEPAVAVGRLWAVPAAIVAYLLWRSAITTPGAMAVRTAPAVLAVSAALAIHGTAADAVAMGAMAAAGGVLAVLASVPRSRAAAARDRLARNQADLDAVVMANLELRNTGEAADAAVRVARIATELLDAEGAVVWLQGPERLLCAGGYGTTPRPEREVRGGSTVERVLLTGSVAHDEHEMVLPLTASGGVFGAVEVNRPRRGAETFVGSVLQVFGAQAGYTLERLRAVEELIDARFVDPVTGVGNRLAATASLATMRTGDAVLLIAVDDLEQIRATHGDARADLVLGQLSLHIRTATRAGDLIARFDDDLFFVMLRDLNASTESVVTRLLASWKSTGTAAPLRAGAALHFADTSPLDTLDRASQALDAARDDHRSPVAVAAERAVWGPAAA